MLDLPRFVVIQYNTELDFWQLYAVKSTYDEAKAEFNRANSNGEESVYLAGLAMLHGPGDNIK